MTDNQRIAILLRECHRHIAEAAHEAVDKLGDGATSATLSTALSYPPGATLTAAEAAALASLRLTPAARNALQKLVADGCATAFFQFFCLLDAVGDPEVVRSRETWLGARLAAPRDPKPEEMLHDAFFRSWHEYARRVTRRAGRE